MKKRLLFITILLLSTFICPAERPELPVFFLRYDGGLGSEEIETEEGEEEIEPSSQRHTFNLRIKEEWSDLLTTNLYTAFSRKEYFLEKGSYSYFYLNPDVNWEITDNIKWNTEFRSKWTVYDETDSKGLSKDLTSLLARTNFTFKLFDNSLEVVPSFQGVFDLYENQEKSRQTLTFGVGLSSKLGNVNLGGKYRGILRYPLGEQSAVTFRFNNEFSLNATWDPN